MANRGTLILVPGFLGSELRYPVPFTQRQLTVWLDYARLIAGGWRLLELPAPLLPLVAGPALTQFYGPLIDRLSFAGWTVQSAELDWRETIQADGNRLAMQIRRAWFDGHGEPVSLIGHSRGGLVMRAALQTLQLAGQLAFVGNCVGLAVPHQGSLGAAALLGGWQETKLLVYALLAVSQTLLAGGWPKVELNRVISTWPGAYELLPRPGSTWLQPNEVFAVYSVINYTIHGLPLNPAYLAGGRDNWATRPEAPAEVPWIDLVGFGFDTPVGLATQPAELQHPAGYRFSLLGDGVVQVDAARQTGRAFQQFRTDHQGICQHGPALDRAASWLAEGVT